MFASWLLRAISRKPSRSARRASAAAGRRGANAFRPAVGSLEDRSVPAFLAPASYATGAAPTAVSVADVNGDGRQDLIALSSTSAGSVSVLLGNGDGTFQAARVSAAGTAPTTLVVSDLDGDGVKDVATSSSVGGGALYVMKGNNDGTFRAPVASVIGTVPTGLSKGDFNHDGRDDLITSTVAYGGTAMVLLNNGDGTFAPPRGIATGSNPMEVEAADFNEDGNDDVLVPNQFTGGTVSVMLGNGDGSFQSGRNYAAGQAPYKVEVADFDRDGHADVVALNSYTSASMSVLLGNGDGSFRPYTTYDLPTAPNDVGAGDFNGDGNVDLIEPAGAGYEVELGRGDGSFYAPTVYGGTPGSRTVVGDFNGDGSDDVANSSPTGAVTVLVNAADGVANLAGAVGFQVSAPAATVAGSPFAVTVTAVDANGNAAAGFAGSVALTLGSGAVTQPLSYTFTAADGGTHTFTTAALTTAGVQTVAVTSPFLPTASRTVTVTPAAASKLAVAAAATAAAGGPLSITVTAQDAYGNTTAGYAGTVRFGSSDAQAVLPAAYTFTAADAGVHTFTATLKTAGLQRVAATDAATPLTAGTSNAVAVTPGAAVSLSLVGGGGFVGSAQAVTVTARDSFGNIDTSYAGTIHLTSSDARTVLPADAALVNGRGTFTVTPMALGTQTLAAADVATGALTGSESVVVTPGWATRFAVTPLAATVAGGTQALTVTAYDAFGNVSTVYTGTVRVTGTDPRLSVVYTFTAADAGVHTLPVTLTTAGTQSVTVADAANPAVAATQTGVVVAPAAAAYLTVTSLRAAVAGTVQGVTVTARDAYGNVATGYRGTLAFSSLDTLASLPAAYTFTAADAGTHAFSVALKSAGGQTFGVADARSPALAFAQTDIAVYAGAVASFGLRVPSNATLGAAFTVTVSALDAYGNVVTGYTGKVRLSGPSSGLFPADYAFTAADAGSHAFAVTLNATGTPSLQVVDTGTPSLKGAAAVTVKANGGGGGGGGGGTATGGTASGGGGGGGGGKKTA